MDRLGYAGRNVPYMIGIGVITLLVWPLSAWVYGVIYVKPVRKAMRERGYDLSINCEYLLNELPAEIERCPECGQRR